jgi:hypothetical protein
MTANTTPKPPTREDLPVWLEYVRSTFEVLALIVLVATMIYTARGVAATRAAVEASTAQLREAQYESVYGHELDLWKLAAEHPALAPYIVGGKKPPEVMILIRGRLRTGKYSARHARTSPAEYA